MSLIVPVSEYPPGEVYVLNDGGEVDLDLGNYERYLDVTLSRDNNITTGKIYRDVIEKEVCRIQVPHVCRVDPRHREEANILEKRCRWD